MTGPARNRRATDHLPASLAGGTRLPFPWLFATRGLVRKLVSYTVALQQQNAAQQAVIIRLQDQLNRLQDGPHDIEDERPTAQQKLWPMP